jgi:hypothetical protein
MGATLMGLLVELAIGTVAQVFGYAAGKDQPWWVEIVAYLSCLLILLAPLALLLVLLS